MLLSNGGHWGEIVYGANVCLEMKKKTELQTKQKK